MQVTFHGDEIWVEDRSFSAVQAFVKYAMSRGFIVNMRPGTGTVTAIVGVSDVFRDAVDALEFYATLVALTSGKAIGPFLEEVAETAESNVREVRSAP